MLLCCQQLLVAHDKVANKEFPATMIAMEQENIKDRRQFRRVRIEKNTSEPLVSTIVWQQNFGLEVKSPLV